MSPEQATAEKDLTARADIYSLGSVLYEMLAGEPPHLGNSAQQIIMKIIADEARPITDLRKSVPPHVAAAVAQSLERLPADRFGSAAEFASALTDGRFTRPTTSAARMPESKADWRHRIAVPAVATALVLLGVAAWGWLRSTPDRTATPGWRVNVALPDNAQLYGGPSLSPDGSVMVYGGENGIWMRAAGTTTPIPIPGTEEGTNATLSPDGRQVAFLDAAGGVRVIPAGGGTARLVGKANLQAPIGWTDDDHVVFGTLAGLVRQPAVGGEPLQFTRTDTASGEAYHVAPAVIPEDRGVVFTVMGAGSYDSTWIAIVGPGGGDHVRLMPGIRAQYAHPNHLLVAQRGGIVAVPFDPGRRQLAGTPIPIVTGLRPRVFTTVGQLAVSHSGRLVYVAAGGYNDLVSKDVTLVDREGLATTVAPGWSGYFQTVALSPDRRRVAVGVYTEGAEAILVRDLGSGATARIAMAGYQLRDVVFDRTGSTLYFAALGVGDPGIYQADLAGASAPVLATPSGVGHIAQPTISPSGDRLFYSRYDDPRIFAARLESHVVDTFPRPPDGRVGIPQPSPDGRWLAYRSTESGESEIYVRSTDPSRSVQWQVSQGGVRRLTRVRWAPDGSELFYVAYDTMRAVRVSIDPTFETHTQEPLFSMAEFAYAFDVASDGRFVMLRRRPDLREPTELVMLERWLDLLPEEN